MQCFVDREPRATRRGLVVALLVCVGYAGWAVWTKEPWRLLAAVFLFAAALFHHRNYLRSERVLLGPDGVGVIHFGKQTEFYHWEEITEICYENWLGRAQIFCAAHEPARVFRYHFFGGIKQTKRFVEKPRRG